MNAKSVRCLLATLPACGLLWVLWLPRSRSTSCASNTSPSSLRSDRPRFGTRRSSFTTAELQPLRRRRRQETGHSEIADCHPRRQGAISNPRVDRQPRPPRRYPGHERGTGSPTSRHRAGSARTDPPQFPVAWLYDVGRSDLHARRDGALEGPRARARHLLLRRRCADGRLPHELDAKTAALPGHALHVDRARHRSPCRYRSRDALRQPPS